MCIGTGGRVGLSEELNRVALEDMFRYRVVVRFVNGQDECRHTVATISSPHGVTVDTCFS